jgi:predicted acylesterase/phospholipase RssA
MKDPVDKAISILSDVEVSEVLRDLVERLNLERKKKGLKEPVTDAELLLRLAKELMRVKELGFARHILARAAARNPEGDLKAKIHQQWAVSTYKDPDLPAERRLRESLDRLRGAGDLNETTSQETLGIAGAIHKRLWEFSGRREPLELAWRFYHRGRMQGVAGDQGYTAINEAYLLDLLASLDEKDAAAAGKAAPEAQARRDEAYRIREQVVAEVPPLASAAGGEWLRREWWYYSTIGEAYFGTRRYEEAVRWLVDEKPADLNVADWEYESTARQLASLARIQLGDDMSAEEFALTQAGQALKSFFGNDNVEAVRSAFTGKIGLALSGGGFRASLFHIGVLARLAELDLLRRVEVLSCVSGGSMVGAHYYLEVRRLLQTKSDGEINRQDYVEIVKRIERDFLAGVQRNVRTRVASSLLTNLKMIFVPGYSRTLRAGELYESEIFSMVEDDEGRIRRRKFWLKDLLIKPAGTKDFNPKYHNWKRGAKAPILIINAATLNTGHSWHFTITYMGEPPGAVDPEIDGNYRLRRMYYGDAPLLKDGWPGRLRQWASRGGAYRPTPWRSVRLGHAVAASACVPGVFEPVALDHLYEDAEVKPDGEGGRPPKALRVRLVDGGVCDNQGVMGLSDAECDVMLVSDASGQMEAEAAPGAGLLSVPLRSSGVLQARVRAAQYQDLRERRRAGRLRGLMFVHLKQDLGVRPLNWRECPDHRKASDFDESPKRAGGVTRYNVTKDVQRLLAGVRTDLDSFCDVEADALMASAYLMTRWKLDRKDDDGRGCIDGLSPEGAGEKWKFSDIVPYLAPIRGDLKVGGQADKMRRRKEKLKGVVGASGSVAFKIWKLSPALKVVTGVAAVGLLALIVWGVSSVLDLSLLTEERVNRLAAAASADNLERLAGKLTIGNILLAGLALFVALSALAFVVNLVGKKLLGVVRWGDTLTSIVFGVFMTLFGFIAAWIHLKVFDRLYLRWGRRERFYGGS